MRLKQQIASMRRAGLPPVWVPRHPMLRKLAGVYEVEEPKSFEAAREFVESRGNSIFDAMSAWRWVAQLPEESKRTFRTSKGTKLARVAKELFTSAKEHALIDTLAEYYYTNSGKVQVVVSVRPADIAWRGQMSDGPTCIAPGGVNSWTLECDLMNADIGVIMVKAKNGQPRSRATLRVTYPTEMIRQATLYTSFSKYSWWFSPAGKQKYETIKPYANGLYVGRTYGVKFDFASILPPIGGVIADRTSSEPRHIGYGDGAW